MGFLLVYMMCVMLFVISFSRFRICENGVGERYGKIVDVIEEFLNEDDDFSY